jgi:hypothetical protein
MAATRPTPAAMKKGALLRLAAGAVATGVGGRGSGDAWVVERITSYIYI